jgi:peptide/nickel transport system substrate-binding protein
MRTVTCRRLLAAPAALALGLLALPAAAQELAAVQRVTHAVTAGDIGSLDPTLPWVSVEAPIVTVVMQGLVEYPPGEVSIDFQPSLAESWEVSADGRVYTFHLRRGVQWHKDFGEFTAEDVKFTLDRYRNPDVSAWHGNYTNVQDVEVVDTHTVRVTLRSSDPFFLALVAGNTESVGLMLSRRAFEERGADRMRLDPIGTGPFVFEEYVPRDRVVMRRNDDYWDGAPILDEVVIRFMPSSTARELALRTGEIDTMRATIDAQLLDRLAAQGYIIDRQGPEIVWWHFINTTRPPLDDIRVRKAIAHAINPAELAAFLGPVAEIADAIIPPTYFGAASHEELPEEGRWSYDPELAKELLAEAGLADGFALSMIITERDDYRQQMVLIQEHLKQVGIELELNLVDHAHYHSQIIQHVNPLIHYGDIAYPNSGIFLNRTFKTGALRNFANWSSPEFDALLEQISATPNLDDRRALMVEAQGLIARDFIVVPTTFTGQPLVRHPRVDLGYELRSSLVLEYRFGNQSRILAVD